MKIKWFLAPLWVVFVFMPGCVLFYGHRQINMEVRDAETDKPIVGATVIRDVSITAPVLILNRPESKTFITDAEGKASGRVPIRYRDWYILASGYMSRFYAGNEMPDESRETQVFRLFKEPGPVFEIILRPDFYGPLFIQYVCRDDPGIFGNRNFKASVVSGRVVEIPVHTSFKEINKEYCRFKLISSETQRPLDTPVQTFYPTFHSGERRMVYVGDLRDSQKYFDEHFEPNLSRGIEAILETEYEAARGVKDGE